jgi:hypothetical protein
MTPMSDLARDFHELWERALKLHFRGRELLERIQPRDAYRRLALEIALHDLELLAARAAALATLAEASPRRKKRKS